MNEKKSNIIKVILLLLILFFTCGCVNTNNSSSNKQSTNKTVYSVRPFTIIVLEPEQLNSIASNYFEFPVYGFFNPNKRTMYVPYGRKTNEFNGNKLPDLYILGHEILHLQEVEGHWHKF